MDIRSAIKRTALGRRIVSIRSKKRAADEVERNRAFHAEAETVLANFAEALNKEGIVFWLKFGTLLGYYREHDFISHGCDMDCGVRIEDMDRCRAALLRVGFELVMEHRCLNVLGQEDCFRHKDYRTTIDVFYWLSDGTTRWSYSFGPCVNQSFHLFFNTKKRPIKVCRTYAPDRGFHRAVFKGIDVYVTNDEKEYLELHYGPDFMIPNPSFCDRKESRNNEYYEYKECPGTQVIYQNK